MLARLIRPLCILLPLSICGMARANTTLLVDDRQLYMEVYGESLFGGDQSQREYLPEVPFEPIEFGDALQSTGAQSAGGDVSGSLSSTVSATRFTASGTVLGGARVFDETAYSSLSTASARFQVHFALDQAATGQLVADWDASGTGLAGASIWRGRWYDGELLKSWSVADFGHVDELLPLSAGDYTLAVYAAMTSQVYAQSDVRGAANFGMTFTVPEPSTAVLLTGAAVGSFAFRQRHRTRMPNAG